MEVTVKNNSFYIEYKDQKIEMIFYEDRITKRLCIQFEIKCGTRTVTHGAIDHIPTLFSLKASDDRKLEHEFKLVELTVDNVIQRLKSYMH
jgi:hypothetical protein